MSGVDYKISRLLAGTGQLGSCLNSKVRARQYWSIAECFRARVRIKLLNHELAALLTRKKLIFAVL